MKIDNKTVFHDNQVRKIINFVMPPIVKVAIDKAGLRVQFRLRTGDGATGQTGCALDRYGKIYWDVYVQVTYNVCSYPFQENLRERNKLSERACLGTNGGTNDHAYAFIQTREEHLVHILAHELFHIAQKVKSVVANEKEAIYSDLEADKYAIEKQRAWRKLHNNPVYALPEEIPQ